MKHYVGRLIKTMSKAMPKRVLTCTMKTYKTEFKAVSAYTIGYSASKQVFDWKKATKIKFCVQTFVQKQNYGR